MPHTFARALLLAAPACQGIDDPVDAGSANYSAGLSDEPDFSVPHGRIRVDTWFDYGETQLQGGFADGPQPRHHSEAERSGGCRLLTYSPSSCDPACEDSALCVEGECQPWPEYQDYGPLLWSWPDGEQTVEPTDWYAYWATGSASGEGDVTVELAAFTLSAPTITSMDPVRDWDRVIESRGDGDAALQWTNPVLDARVRLHMTDCEGSHGGIAAAELECEGPDTGELVIPGSYLSAIEQGDWSHGECGSHTWERYHAATPEGDDTLRFETIGPSGLFWFPG